METKILLRLIKDDISDLQGIANDFNMESLPASDDVELALVRANGLLRQLELLYKLTEKKDRSLITSEPSAKPSIEVQQINHTDQVRFGRFDSGNDHGIMNLPAEVSDEPIVTNKDLPIEKEDKIIEKENVPITIISIEEKTESLVNEIKSEQSEITVESNQMVNDLLIQSKSESGYQITRIDSIWDGIGINDRFLYTRELFENSSTKFETAVNALNQLDTIQEAVNYLKMNFKWHKSETSQKFLVLVKRRFTK